MPELLVENVELDGNAVLQSWFSEQPTQALSIQMIAEVETYRSNPFLYRLDPRAVTLPIDYPASLAHSLHPYLTGLVSGGGLQAIDPTAMQLAQEIWLSTQGDLVGFLSELNQQIYHQCEYSVRDTGSPYPPGITWQQKAGSCRDYAVLFMETCRAMGLASRFVSGYHVNSEGDQTLQENLHLHAWCEVYLPGAGWRGYDPAHGVAVADNYITLFAAPTPRDTAPIVGSRKTKGVQSQLHYQLKIQILAGDAG
jgi:transglutaminase-like putative cysteine protease